MFQLWLEIGFTIHGRVFGCFAASFEGITRIVKLNGDMNVVFWGEVNESLLGHPA